jgi:hypothetical protein
MKKVIIYSERDLRIFVKEEVEKRFYFFERLLNTLHLKVIDLEKIIEMKK